jgi:beta-glucosidase
MNGGEWFVAPLRRAYADGKLPKERLSDMVRRILRSMYAVGVDKWGPPPRLTWRRTVKWRSKSPGRHRAAQNDGVLPLAPTRSCASR